MASHRKKKGGAKKKGGGARKFEQPKSGFRSPKFPPKDDYRPHWSLSQEARNTGSAFSRLRGSQLRHNPVIFVSGGTLAQENYAKVIPPVTRESSDVVQLPGIDNQLHATDIPRPTAENLKTVAEAASSPIADTAKFTKSIDDSAARGRAASRLSSSPAGSNSLENTQGDDSIMKCVEAVHRVTLNGPREEPSLLHDTSSSHRHTDHAESSDLSDDEVVFRGRNTAATVTNAQVVTETPSTAPYVQVMRSSPDVSPPPPTSEPTEDGPAPAWAFERKSGAVSESEAESDVLRDYIENLDRDGMYESEDDTSDEEANIIEKEEEVDIDFFDDVSTSDEMPNTVGAILSIRARQSGTQFLVTGPGETINQAKWASKEHLISRGAQSLLDNYLREAALSSSDDDVDEDDQDDILDSDGDEAANDHEPDAFMEQLSDEHIARALAKQEELGYLNEDVMIFDGTEDIDFTYKKSETVKVEQKRNNKQKKNRYGSFPSASAFVDVLDEDPYEAYDIMDFDMPSLRKRNKGKRQPIFDLSDDELAWQMEMSWELDRKKKAAKKREREELRRQGLLGSKNGKPDMSAKYSTGMTIDDVKKELRLFLASSSGTLSLPPMSKKDRKIVHEMAHMLNLKSLSRGSGKSRFPTLTKTSRTPHVRESEMDNFFSSNKILRRLDRPRYDRSNRSTGGTKAATYEHGEVVGARAPEIGAGNKGREMLEKMGWSSGTALGALNNKGILEPVAHVVRKGKAGLG